MARQFGIGGGGTGGLAGYGLGVEEQADQGLSQSASDEARRNMENQRIMSANRAGNAQLGSTVGGLAGGALAGSEWGSAAGPWGAAIGAIAGGLLGGKF
jgi:hypothetical protein